MPLGLNYTEKAEKIRQIETQEQATSIVEWEQPIPFNNVSVPPFPVDCLPPSLKNYVLSVSEATQTPVDMAAVASLAVMSLCVQGRFKIQGKPDWTEPLNLYGLLVASPAERKSAVLNLLTKFIYEYECKENEKNIALINRSKTEKKLLQKEVDKLIDTVAKDGSNKELLMYKQDELTNFEEIRPLRLFTDDVTAEALTSLLAENGGKMAMLSSEGGVFETLLGRYSQSANLDTFLKAHCGDPIRVDRKGRESEYIKEPCLTVLLSVQPQVLDGLVSNEIFRGRGLTARFLYSIPISTVGRRQFETEPIPTEYETEYRELCFELLDLQKDKKTEIIKLSEEAYILSANFARELEPRLINDLDGMADFAGKLHGAILRIAGILHAVEAGVFTGESLINKETMQAAINIGYYFLEHAKAAYQLMGTDEQLQGAKYILRQLEKQSERELAKYDIFRLCRGKYKKVEEILQPVELLIEYGYLQGQPQEQISNRRQKENRYILNPKYFG